MLCDAAVMCRSPVDLVWLCCCCLHVIAGEVMQAERDALLKLIGGLRREYEAVQMARGSQEEELRLLKEKMSVGVSDGVEPRSQPLPGQGPSSVGCISCNDTGSGGTSVRMLARVVSTPETYGTSATDHNHITSLQDHCGTALCHFPCRSQRLTLLLLRGMSSRGLTAAANP